jgi:hypothetical protein
MLVIPNEVRNVNLHYEVSANGKERTLQFVTFKRESSSDNPSFPLFANNQPLFAMFPVPFRIHFSFRIYLL